MNEFNALCRWMDNLGPDGCEQRLNQIVSRLAAMLPRVPCRRLIARRMVKQAIRRARRKEKAQAASTDSLHS